MPDAIAQTTLDTTTSAANATANTASTLPVTEPATALDSTVADTAVAAELNTSGMLDFQQLQSLLETGGPVMMILLGMSVIGLAVFFLKCWQFMQLRLGNTAAIDLALQQWRTKGASAALETLARTKNPIARIAEVAIPLKEREANDDTLIREEVMRIAMRQLANARSHLRVLELIATLSPLLGLLGTVLGMITAFQKLQGAGTAVDPAILSGGIWEALLTTAAGLVVAIPAVVALNWLEKRVESFKLAMEDAMTRLFTIGLTAPSLANNVKRTNTRPARKTAANADSADNDLALAT